MLPIALALGLVIADAHILTLDPSKPHARHAAVVDGRFAYVGDDLAAARKAAGADAKELDAGGATVVPGFNDGHVHFGLSLTIGAEAAVDLGDGTDDVQVFGHAIREAAARPVSEGEHDWIFVVTRALPSSVHTAADLPAIDRPLFVVTEHGGLMNHLAQQRGGFSDTEVPHGQVRGRLLPAALDRIVKKLPREVLLKGARRFLAELGRLGLTSVQLMDELPELWESLRKEGQLTARIRMMAFGFRFETPRYVPTWKPVDPSWVQLDAVKYFHDDWARLPRAELSQIYDEVRAAGRPVVMHVLSRSALRGLLDQLERLEAEEPGGARHFRLDHVDEATPELIRRIAQLGIVVCPNPAMLPEWRKDRSFPMRSLLAAGVTTCIGSDFVGRHRPARPLSPLFGLQMAVTHGGYGDAERVSVAEALRAYTRGSALAEGRQDKGMIREGALADLVGLGGDPTVVAPKTLADLEVRFTIVGGRIVYEHRPPVVSRTPPSTIGPAGSAPPPRQSRPSTIGPPSPTGPATPTIGPGNTSHEP